MTDIVWIVSVLTAYFLGYWVGEYGPPLFRLLDGVRLPQLRWPFRSARERQLVAEALAYRQARESKDRTIEPLVVGNWPPKSLYERVTALEPVWAMAEKHEDRLQALEARVAEVENVMNQIHKLNPPLPLATPSRPTENPTTDSPSDAAEQESIPPESPASWRSGLTTMTGGPAGQDFVSVEPTDAST